MRFQPALLVLSVASLTAAAVIPAKLNNSEGPKPTTSIGRILTHEKSAKQTLSLPKKLTVI